jgi:flavin-dependent dehydrogenase
MRHNDMLPRASAPLLLGKSALRAMLWRRLRELDCEELDAEQIGGAALLRGGTLLHLRPAIASGEQAILGRIVIDATGRASVVARRLGVRRRTFDSLVSFWISGDAGDRLLQATITATVRDGWIFYAGAGAGRAAVGFFTAGSHVGQKPTAASIVERARGIAEIAEIFESCPDWEDSSVTTRNAATTLLERACGPGWIACGDALQTVDPLASSGNFIALKQGMLAAAAAKAALTGDETLMHAYAMATQKEFRKVLRYRSGYYGLVS